MNSNIERLEKLLEYFEGLDEHQINQRIGCVYQHDLYRDDGKACGCFGMHCDLYFDLSGGIPNKVRWTHTSGRDSNNKYLRLNDWDIRKAWLRLNHTGGIYLPEPYGDEPWPFTPVETLRNIIKWRKANDC